MPRLTNDEVQSFLQERGHLARIATIKADGSPSVVPVWFICEEGKVIITPRKYSAFYANIQRDPRVAVTIDEEAGHYRKVLVEGAAEILYPLGYDDDGAISTGVFRAAMWMISQPTITSLRPSTNLGHSLALN